MVLLYFKVPRTGDSEVTFSFFESSYSMLLSVYPLKGRGNPVKCLAQGHNKRSAGLSSHYRIFVLNIKQVSCENQLLKSFGLNWPLNQSQGIKPTILVNHYTTRRCLVVNRRVV